MILPENIDVVSVKNPTYRENDRYLDVKSTLINYIEYHSYIIYYYIFHDYIYRIIDYILS